MKYEDKQKILEAVNLEERYEVLGGILCNEIDIMQIRTDLNSKVKERWIRTRETIFSGNS